MSQDAGSIGSGSPSSAAGAPPPSSPVVSSPGEAPPPAAAPVVAEPVAPPVGNAAAPAEPAPSEPARPQSLGEAQAKYRSRVAKAIAGEPAQPPAEAQPKEPPAEPVVPPPVAEELPPVEKAAPDSVEAEPAAEIEEPAPVTEELETGSADLEEILTADTLEAKFPRQLSKKVKAEILAREEIRGRQAAAIIGVGGEPGMELAKALNPIIWKNNPTDADAETFLDQLILPEHAGALQLFNKVSQHFVENAIFDEERGPEFASTLIQKRFGNQPNGQPYDFAKVEQLVEAHKAGVVLDDYIAAELEGREKPEPTARELELQRENEELKAGKKTEQTEQERKREEVVTQYKTQAEGYISRYVMEEITPLAVKANWTLVEGSKDDPQAESKKLFGDVITTYLNRHIMGTAKSPDPDYAEVQGMIDDYTAFDSKTGQPTPRFLVKLAPLRTKAKAKFNELQRGLGGAMKFAAETSHNAKLVALNGGKKGAQAVPPELPPPVAAPAPQPGDKPMTTEDRLEANRRKFREARAAELAQENVGQLHGR